MTARMITVHDIYSFDPNAVVSWEPFSTSSGAISNSRRGFGLRQQPGLAHVAHYPPFDKVSLKDRDGQNRKAAPVRIDERGPIPPSTRTSKCLPSSIRPPTRAFHGFAAR